VPIGVDGRRQLAQINTGFADERKMEKNKKKKTKIRRY
jgi:hypothetical protein